MNVIVRDNETNGMVLWKEPSDSPEQPHIVEIAALLFNEETGELIDRLHAIVRPDGWTIPDEVIAIHGITMERAMDEGKPEHEVLEAYLALHQRAHTRVAHQKQFDDRIERIAMKRFGDGRATHASMSIDEKNALADDYRSRTSICTMKQSYDASAKALKWPPTLTAAYLHFTGKELVGAHGALADATACAEVYFAIRGAS